MQAVFTLLEYLFIILLLDGLGKVILPKNESNSLFLRISCGVIAASIALTALGFLNLLNQKFILILAGGSYLLLFPGIKNNIENYLSKINQIRCSLNKEDWVFIFLIVLYLVLIFLNTLTPPISRDALNYHLYLPQIWLQKNRIYSIPNNIYSYFPAYWEVFNTFLLTISNDICPKLFHYFYLILTIFLIAKFLKLLQPLIKQQNILTAVLIFLSAPTISRIASWAYIDLIFTFYSLLALYLLLKFYRERNKVFFYCSALALGFSLGMKYTGWIWLICLIFIFLEKEPNSFRAIISYSRFAFLAIIIAAPFYIRNIFLTGNPFYPFLNHIFKSLILSPEKYNLILLYFHSYGRGTSFKDLILLPWRLIFKANFKEAANFDGKIGLLYLIAALSFLKIPKKNIPRSIFYIMAVYTLSWFFLSQQLRFLIPVLALLAICFGFYLNEYKNKYLNYILLIGSFFYLAYPLHNYLTLKPWKFFLGQESRTDFLDRNLSSYPIIQYINKNLPPSAKIMLLDTGPIAYYIKRDISQESIFEDYTFKLKLKISCSVLLSYLRKNHINYIFTNEFFLKNYFIKYLNKAELKNLRQFLKKDLRLISHYKNFRLYKVNPLIS